MDVMQWLTGTQTGTFCLTSLVSMIPVVELRGGIPFGVAAGLPVWKAYLAAIIGNMLPVPFIVVYIRRVFLWLRRRFPKLNGFIDRLEQKGREKGGKIKRYEWLGLALLVAIPLPGTGAWTGALAAALLNMSLRRSLPAIAVGVVVAGILVSMLTYGVSALI